MNASYDAILTSFHFLDSTPFIKLITVAPCDNARGPRALVLLINGPPYTFGRAGARLPNVVHSSKDDNRPDSIETETVHDIHFENA